MSQLKTATKEMANYIQELKASAREITQWGSDLRKALAGTIGVESDQLHAAWDKMSVTDRAGFGGSFEKYSTAVGKYLSTQEKDQPNSYLPFGCPLLAAPPSP